MWGSQHSNRSAHNCSNLCKIVWVAFTSWSKNALDIENRFVDLRLMWNMMPYPPSTFSGDCNQRETEVRRRYISPMLLQGLCWERACAHYVSFLWEELLPEVTTKTVQTVSVKVTCKHMNYCPSPVAHRHRHQSDHECENLEVPKPRMAATQKLVKDIIGKYLESVFVVDLLPYTLEFRALLLSACRLWKVLLAALMVITCCRFWGHSCDSIFHKSYLASGNLEIPWKYPVDVLFCWTTSISWLTILARSYIHEAKVVVYVLQRLKLGLPGGPVVKNPPANAGDTGLIPDARISHMLWGSQACVP